MLDKFIIAAFSHFKNLSIGIKAKLEKCVKVRSLKLMKILIPVKRVIDYNVKVRVKSDNTGVDLANVKMSMNPFDEIALEEAIRIREAGRASEVIAVSIRVLKSQETLRPSLAM